MPRKSGFDCLEEIRTHGTSVRDLKIIMLSTSNSPDIMLKAKDLGATYYAVKPNSVTGLRNLLSEVLETDILKKKQKKFRLI